MRWGLVVVSTAVAVAIPVASAQAATFEVTKPGDAPPNGCSQGGCTLREATIAANARAGADSVLLEAGKKYTLSIPGAGEDAGLTGDLDVTDGLTIRSSGAKKARLIDADQGGDQSIEAFARLTVNGLDIAGEGDGVLGRAALEISGSAVKGGGVGFAQAGPGSLRLTQSTVRQTTFGVTEEGDGGLAAKRLQVSENSAGGIEEDGGGNLSLSKSVLEDNLDDGVKEFGLGSVVIDRSRVVGSDEVGDGDAQGVQEFDDGALKLTRSRVADSETEGVEEFSPGNLVITRSLIDGNGDRGAQDFSDGELHVERSTFRDNGRGLASFGDKAVVERSSVRDNGGGFEAGIYVGTDMTLRDSEVTQNRTESGDGGGIVVGGGNLLLTDSTVAGNTAASGSGGGIYVASGQVLTAVNSTLAGNRADLSGGGLRIEGEGRLRSVTVVRNVANYKGTSINSAGGGVNTNAGGFLTATRNSILALNKASNGASFPDCAANLDSAGDNLLTKAAGCSGTAQSDLVKAKPELGQLARNGGPTRTVALLEGSPAIGEAGGDAPKLDQRGRKRDSKPDIGAYER